MEEVKFKRDRHFEERVIQAMLSDHSFAEQMIDVLNVEYFNLEYLKETAKLIFNYYKKYSAFPSLKLLASITKKEIESDLLKGQIINYFVSVKKNPLNGDLEYIKEESLDFCKKRSLALALENSLELIANKKYEAVVGEVEKALLAGSEKEIGHNIKTDLEKRLIKVDNSPVITGWDEFNKLTMGGPGPGKLISILATSGAGKSHCLVDLAVSFACNGYCVAFYTMELLAEEIGLRCDSRVMDMDIEKIAENKDLVQQKWDETKGEIIIKFYPMFVATSLTIKNHFRQLTILGKKPDVIIIDYADKMRSMQKLDSQHMEQMYIYSELKSTASELEVPIYTVCQSNRDGLDSEILKVKNIGESYAKFTVCDVFLTMTRKQSNFDVNKGYMFLAKNRLGVDGIVFPLKVMTSRSKVELLEPRNTQDLEEEKEEFNKEAIRKKFTDLCARLESEANKSTEE